MHKENLIKKNKGITLIALIITIIVMLILVGVSVTVALDGGLFNTAQDAVDKTELAKKGEQVTGELLTQYYVARADGTIPSTQTLEEYVLGKYGLAIGDKINYQEGTSGSYATPTDKGVGVSYTSETLVSGTYKIGATDEEKEAGDMEWRVLGVNASGQIELISEKLTTNTLTLRGKEGYTYAETELDNFCNSIYGKGEGAVAARSLDVNDVNKITNFDPQKDSLVNFGGKFTYQYDSAEGEVKGIKTSLYETYKNNMADTNWKGTGCEIFYTPEWTISSASGEQGPKELEFNMQAYFMDDYYNESNQLKCDMITKGFKDGNLSTSDLETYWIASRYIECLENSASFEVGLIEGEFVNYASLYGNDNYSVAESYYVRPVVTLASYIEEFKDIDGDGIKDVVIE